MKLLLLLIVLFIVGYSQSFAQLRLSASDRTDIKLITSERLKISDSKSPEIANYFPINKINNDWYLSFIGKINNEFERYSVKQEITRKPIITAKKILKTPPTS